MSRQTAALFPGTSLADHSGTDGRVSALAILHDIAELYGDTPPVTVSLGSITTNDFNPGSGFPINIRRVDVNPTVADASNNAYITGILAGYENQRVFYRNISATINLVFLFNNGGSQEANKLSGQGGGLVLTAGGGSRAYGIYYSTPNTRWSVA